LSDREPGDTEATARAIVERDTLIASSFRVAVVDGPDRGKNVVVSPESPGPLHVGTSPVCELALSDRMVSRRHLALSVTGDGLHMRDQGSTNGTLVGDLRAVDVVLGGGERIRVGESTLLVERLAAASSTSLWPVESFGRLLGASTTMRRLYPLCQKLSASSIPVIIEGETGTGKELLAESLHEMGPRKTQPFVVFDSSAIDGRHLEAILFGEESRAVRRGASAEIHKGVFEEASGGTLLIDEIAELPLAVQARLLRVLERGEICRVGGDRWIHVDTRVLATSRQNVDKQVELGHFREDLFFRLAAARIELPPLRKRDGDASMLARHFWNEMAGGRQAPSDLLGSFDGYGWPGNVRELQKAVARKVALGDVDRQSESPQPAVPVTIDSTAFERVLDLNLPFPEARARVTSEFERLFVTRLLAKHGGNISRAAAASGIARRYFQILRARNR
jgi:DNA-binding NtrC family response regulator